MATQRTDSPLTPEQANRFQRDGYLRLPGAVATDQVNAARRLIFADLGAARNAAMSTNAERRERAVRDTHGSTRSEFRDLYEASAVRPCVEAMFGAPALPLRGAQLATLFPATDDAATNEAGYRNSDTPHNGWIGHLDGLWNGGTRVPPAGETLSAASARAWNADRSTNGALKQYSGEQNIANFALLVGIALSDQTVPNCGQLGLLRGAHKHVERFFRWQRDLGGPMGPDGPGWPRENPDAPNGHGLVHYPPTIKRRYARGSVRGEDGMLWPRPTFQRLRAGDAVLVHHATPHSASRVLTDSPRLMVYFRCTPSTRPKQFQDPHAFPDALCDLWLEFPGVREAAARSS